jgi:hypothetical protein
MILLDTMKNLGKFYMLLLQALVHHVHVLQKYQKKFPWPRRPIGRQNPPTTPSRVSIHHHRPAEMRLLLSTPKQRFIERTPLCRKLCKEKPHKLVGHWMMIESSLLKNNRLVPRNFIHLGASLLMNNRLVPRNLIHLGSSLLMNNYLVPRNLIHLGADRL